jgi:hypothetical protein
MDSTMVFFHLMACIVYFYVKLDQCYSQLNFLTVTVSNFPAISAEATNPGFSIALEDMAVKYPALYRNYSVSHVDIEPLSPYVCSPAAAWKVTERIGQLYGSGSLKSTDEKPVIMLTPGQYQRTN